MRRVGPSTLRVSSDGRVRIAVRCSAGCRGTLRLVEQRRGLRERRVGEVAYAGIGSLVLRPRIARYARALAGCRGGLKVRAVLHVTGREPTAGYGQGFGVYRIASRSHCRRGGGPAFTPRRRGPRP